MIFVAIGVGCYYQQGRKQDSIARELLAVAAIVDVVLLGTDRLDIVLQALDMFGCGTTM